MGMFIALILSICFYIKHWSPLAKFRRGVAPLRLGTGRYERILPEQRICFNCINSIESEEHVLLLGTGNQLCQDSGLVQKKPGVVILCKLTCDWLIKEMN